MAADACFGPGQFNAGIVLFKVADNERDLRRAIHYLTAASLNGDLGELTERALLYKEAAEVRLRWVSR
jgi:hypothetical protein